MITTYTLEDQIDTTDMKNEALPLRVVAEVDYDKAKNRIAVTVKTVTMSVKTVLGKTLEIPMDLSLFRDETINQFATQIEEKFEPQMRNEDQIFDTWNEGA